MKRNKFVGLVFASVLMASGCTSNGSTSSQTKTANSNTNVQNAGTEQGAQKENYQLPVLTKSGFESGVDDHNQCHSRVYAEVENPNQDLLIGYVAVNCTVRDQENRIVDTYILTFNNIEPSSKAIDFVDSGMTFCSEDELLENYTYEFAIDMGRQIDGVHVEDMKETAKDYIEISNIKYNDDTTFPELSFDFTNTDDKSHSYVGFLIQYLQDGKIVNQIKYSYDDVANPGETYLVNVSPSSMFPFDFDEVRVLPTDFFTDYYDNMVIINEAVPILD